MSANRVISFIPHDRLVPWRSEIASHWNLVPLKYIIEINQRSLDENTEDTRKIRYIDIGNVNSNGSIIGTDEFEFGQAPSRARRIVSQGDTLISTVRTYLKAIAFCDVQDEELICSTGFAVLSPGNNINPRFLFYWARSLYFIDEVVSRSTGVSYPAINASEIGSLPFPIISSISQRRIAAFLDEKTAEIDELIAMKEQQVALLQRKRMALISRAVTKGLDPHAPMRDSGIEWLGEVPQGWECIRLRYLAHIKYGLGQPPAQLDGGLPLLRATNVYRGSISTDGLIFVDPEDIPYARDPILKTNDILVVRSGAYTGDSAIIPHEYDGAIAGYDMVIRIKKANAHYVAYSLLSIPLLENQINVFRMRAAQPHLNAEELGDCILFIPPHEIQNEIVAYLDRETAHIDSLVATIQEQIEKLGTYRQALITAAVTGKIDVRDVKIL